MPELYGNPYKWQLRKKITELGTELWNEHKERTKMRDQRDYAWCKIEALEAKIKQMEQQAQ